MTIKWHPDEAGSYCGEVVEFGGLYSGPFSYMTGTGHRREGDRAIKMFWAMRNEHRGEFGRESFNVDLGWHETLGAARAACRKDLAKQEARPMEPVLR